VLTKPLLNQIWAPPNQAGSPKKSRHCVRGNHVEQARRGVTGKFPSQQYPQLV